jgi:hypothetical protein
MMGEDRNSPQSRRVCDKCGTPARPDDSFCVSCGNNLLLGIEAPKSTREDSIPDTVAATEGQGDSDFRDTDSDSSSGNKPEHSKFIFVWEERNEEVPVGLAPAEVLRGATEYMVAQGGTKNYTLLNKTEESVTFSSHRRPNLLITSLLSIPLIFYLFSVLALVAEFNIILLIILLLPALFYSQVAGKQVYSTLTATPEPWGSRIRISGNRASGRDKLYEWVKTLPDPKTDTHSEESASPRTPRNRDVDKGGGESTQQNQPNSDIPDQIRKLAELRDAGVISAEEFEAKKAQLLDRM